MDTFLLIRWDFGANRTVPLPHFYFFHRGSTASSRRCRQGVNRPPLSLYCCNSGFRAASVFAEKADRPGVPQYSASALGGRSSGAKRAVSGARTISATCLGISIVSKNEALASAGRLGAALPVRFQTRENKDFDVLKISSKFLKFVTKYHQPCFVPYLRMIDCE